MAKKGKTEAASSSKTNIIERDATSDLFDVVIIGSGPAALSSALYLARAGLKTVVFERGEIGGELPRIAKISNYPGYDGAGKELAARFRAQAEQAGAEIRYGECLGIRPIELSGANASDGTAPVEAERAEAKSAEAGAELKSADNESDDIDTEPGSSRLPGAGASLPAFEFQIDDEIVRARAGLVATGSEPRPLGFEVAPPVSYCALCEGDLARGKNVAVIGGANSAVQESLYLAPLVKRLTLISHSPLKADQYLQDRLRTHTNVEIRENVEPNAKLLANYDYVFVFIGTQPATGFLKDLKPQRIATKTAKNTKFSKIFDFTLEIMGTYSLLDAGGYILTGEAKGRSVHETAYSGLFAAGDVRSGMVKQVATAVGDGVAAATEIIHHLQQRK